MNANKVIANLCYLSTKTKLGNKNPVHQNNDINKAQSSNNTFSSAMLLATIFAIKEKLLSAIDILTYELLKKNKSIEKYFKNRVIQIQDAVPPTLGKEFSEYLKT